MVGMRLKDKEEVITRISKSKTFGTVSSLTMETGEGGNRSQSTACI